MINLYKYHNNPVQLIDFDKNVKQYPKSAYEHTKNIIKGRWPEAESRIKYSYDWWDIYKERFGIM